MQRLPTLTLFHATRSFTSGRLGSLALSVRCAASDPAAGTQANASSAAKPSETPSAVQRDGAAYGGEQSGHSHTAAESAAMMFESIKKKDFTAAQAQAFHLAQTGVSDEYAVPIACILVFLITCYWARSSHYSAVRRSDSQSNCLNSMAGDLQKRLDDVSKSSIEGMQRRTQAMETIQQANGELTTVIDQMTAALRTC